LCVPTSEVGYTSTTAGGAGGETTKSERTCGGIGGIKIFYVVVYFAINIYRAIILPLVLYGCETLSLTLREERRLRVFENRVLRRIFGPRRDEVTGDWRELHNDKLNDL